MAKRYSHYLFPAAEAKWPAQVVCVDCKGSVTRREGAAVIERESLLTWHSVCLQGTMGEYGIARTATGSAVSAWWEALAALTAHPGTVWVVCSDATRVWSLLDLWGAIEHGQARIIDRDDRAGELSDEDMRRVRQKSTDKLGPISPSAVSALRLSRTGYLVTQDPPCIARIRVGSGPGWILWVDSRNYGVHLPDTVSQGPEAAHWLADWWTVASREMRGHRLGTLAQTAGSTAMLGWRSCHYYPGVYCHVHPVASELERAAYVGGRCECYRIGQLPGQVWHYDVRAMYPTICRDELLPIALEQVSTTPEAASRLVKDCPARCIAKVRISTFEPAYPLKRGFDTYYPIGSFVTTLCGPELTDALEYRRVTEIMAAARYKMAPALQSYADAALSLRDTADTIGHVGLKQLAKALAVCLPGKLGQWERRWVFEPNVVPPTQYGEWPGTSPDGELVRYRAIAGDTYRDTIIGTAPDAVPAMAAFVTSHGRMQLLSYIRLASWREVYYVDTDSLILSAEAADRLNGWGLIHQGVAGCLEYRAGPCEVELRGIKWYREGELLVCSGLPRGSVKQAADGASYWYAASAGDQAKGGSKPVAERILRAWSRTETYRHGLVMDDGTVRPLELRE